MTDLAKALANCQVCEALTDEIPAVEETIGIVTKYISVLDELLAELKPLQHIKDQLIVKIIPYWNKVKEDYAYTYGAAAKRDCLFRPSGCHNDYCIESCSWRIRQFKFTNPNFHISRDKKQ